MVDRERRKANSLVWVVMFGLLTPLSIYGTYCRVRLELPRNARWQSVEARLSEVKRVPGKPRETIDGTGRIVGVGIPARTTRSYVYWVEGRQFTIVDHDLYGLSRPADQVITLKYDPDDPRKATYDQNTFWFLMLGYCLFSVVGLWLSIRKLRAHSQP